MLPIALIFAFCNLLFVWHLCQCKGVLWSHFAHGEGGTENSWWDPQTNLGTPKNGVSGLSIHQYTADAEAETLRDSTGTAGQITQTIRPAGRKTPQSPHCKGCSPVTMLQGVHPMPSRTGTAMVRAEQSRRRLTPDSPLFPYSAAKQPLPVIPSNSTPSWADLQGFKLFLQAYVLKGHPDADFLVHKGLNHKNQSFFCTAGSQQALPSSLQRLLVAQLRWPKVGCAAPWPSPGAALKPWAPAACYLACTEVSDLQQLY